MEHIWVQYPGREDVICQNCSEVQTDENTETDCIPMELTPAPDLSE